MITLHTQLCKELDLTYWQLQTINEVKLTINREEKELLRKILLAKGIKLEDSMIHIKQEGTVIVNLAQQQLIFDDVKIVDNNNTIHLAKLANMLQDQEQKKLTWFKLKSIRF